MRNPWRCSFDMGGDKAPDAAATCSRIHGKKWTSLPRGSNMAGAAWKATSASTSSNPDNHPDVLRQGWPDRAGYGLRQLHGGEAELHGDLGHRRLRLSRLASALAGQVYLRRLVQVVSTQMDGQLFIATKGADGKYTMEKAVVDGMEQAALHAGALPRMKSGEVYALTSISTGPVGGHDKVYKIVPAN